MKYLSKRGAEEKKYSISKAYRYHPSGSIHEVPNRFSVKSENLSLRKNMIGTVEKRISCGQYKSLKQK